MKKALISPNEKVFCISAWTEQAPMQPIFTAIPNAERVAEVTNSTFDVATPLFWLDCADNIVADQWYYDSVTAAFVVVPAPVPKPTPVQPVVEGAQTL
jgi:hypothetical protein